MCFHKILKRTRFTVQELSIIFYLFYSYKKLELEALTLLEDARASQSFHFSPMGIAEDVVVASMFIHLLLARFCGSSSPEETSGYFVTFAVNLLTSLILPPEEGYFDSEGDIAFLDNLLSDDGSYNLASKSPGEPLTLPLRNDREFEEYLSLMTCLMNFSNFPGNFHQNSLSSSLPMTPSSLEDS
ncbi:hypothetical protein Tco_0184504 [Tanacetum coccineum]